MHIAEQALALQRAGLSIRIVTYHLGRDVAELPTTRTVRVPWYTKTGPGPSWHKFYVDPLLLATTMRVARAWQPDIIHAHLHEGCVLGAFVARTMRLPLVFDVQGSLTGELIAHRFVLTRPVWLRNVWYALERRIDHWPDVVVAQSTEMRAELEQRFGVPAGRIVMAYDGVNTDVFRPGPADAMLRARLGIPEGRKVVVYLGGLSPHKGVDILLDAFPKVLTHVPEAFLLLMGYPREEHYRRRVYREGLQDAVRVTGRIPYEEASRYLRLGDIAVAPKRSQTEANGKIYNYMAAGLPTVAFDTIVNRDILGDLGVYVYELDDIKGLAAAMVKLLTDEQARKDLAEKIREKAVRDYSWDKVAGRLAGAYAKAQRLAQRPTASVEFDKLQTREHRGPQ